MSKGLAITRPAKEEASLWITAAILPTNTSDCCFITYTDVEKSKQLKLRIGRRWNPLAEDLLADDWEVTDYIQSSDLMAVIR